MSHAITLTMARMLALAPTTVSAWEPRQAAAAMAPPSTSGLRGNFSTSFLPSIHLGVCELRRADCRKWQANGVRAQGVAVAERPKMSEIVRWQENKRLQTQIVPIASDTKTIRSLDWDRDRFDMYAILWTFSHLLGSSFADLFLDLLYARP